MDRQGRDQEINRGGGGRNLKPCQLTFLKDELLYLLQVLEDLSFKSLQTWKCGFLAVERVGFNPKILL